MKKHEHVLREEAEWWGDCANTYHEEQKQIVYAARMGLYAIWNCAHPPTFDLGGRSVVDIGGGPVSLLLKCVNFGGALVVDPAPFPAWVEDRYLAHGVEFKRSSGEAFRAAKGNFDEAWIYNTLQHVRDPARVVLRARHAAQCVRIFEWLEIPPYAGHPHTLRAEALSEWLGAEGFVTQVNEDGAQGLAFYGVFS